MSDITDAEVKRCAYCDAEISDESVVPDVDDNEAWEKLAAEHEEWCEWIQTKAHWREDANE